MKFWADSHEQLLNLRGGERGRKTGNGLDEVISMNLLISCIGGRDQFQEGERFISDDVVTGPWVRPWYLLPRS